VLKPALVVVCVCLGVAPIRAQLSPGELRIVVTDATGLALPSSGTLASDASQTHRSFDTDAAGRFTFDRLAPGLYRLTVSSAGFAPHNELVDIRSALPRDVRVVLNVAPVAASVTVTGAPTLVDAHRAGVAYTVGAQQVREQQSAAPGRELLDLVNLQPGWLMESNGVLHPRGSEYQTLFVVDGVPMDDNRSPAFAPELPDAEIEAISVITGTFPAEYGRKLGGVVDVTTSRDARLGGHGSIEAGAGSFGTGTAFASAGYGWDRRSLTVNAGTSRTNRYLDPPTEVNDGNDGALGSVGVMFNQQASPRDRIQIGWRESKAAFRVPNDLVQEAAGQRQDRSLRERAVQAAWSRVASPRLLLNVRAAAADLATDLWSNPAATPIVVAQQRGFRREYAKVALSAQAGAHEIRIGGDIAHAPVHEALQYRITDASAFSRGTPPTFAFADRQTDTEHALFAQDTMRLGNLTASVGLRWDRYAFVVNDSAFSPRLGIAWATSSAGLVLRMSYDRAFQTPAMENLLLASSPQVDQLNRRILRLPVPPSRGDYVEGGFSAAIAKLARLDTTMYRRTFTNFADDDVFLNTGISFPIAFSRADIRGVDVKVTLPRWRAVSGFAGYSYLLGRADLPVTGGLFLGSEAANALAQTDRVPISQDQRHTARARLRYQLAPRAWTAAVVRYGSGLPVELDDDADEDGLVAHFGSAVVDRVDLEGGRVRPNVAVDWGAGVELWRREKRRIELRAEIANITNCLNVVNLTGLFSGTAIAPPRSANVRVRLEF
jgi:outer membrane cobalamin receptor